MSTFATPHQAAQPQRSPSPTPSSESSSRDDIMTMISLQAASVRRTFEENDNKRRKNYNSSATAAAAHHMAAISRKRKFETSIAAVTTPLQRNAIFHSAIALCTRPEAKRTRSHGSARIPTSSSNKIKFPSQSPKVLDGLVLRTGGSSVIQLNYNDVICGKGKTTAKLVGNQRFKVWLDLHKESFAKSLNDEDRRRCAEKIVHAIHQSVPSGRFLSLDFLTGVWRDVGSERSVGIVMDALATGVLMDCDRLQLARVPQVRTFYPRVA